MLNRADIGAASALGRFRVLVLEDNEFERRMLVAMLLRMGVGHVAQAVSGNEALAIMDREPLRFDAVLCDLQMNDLSCLDGIKFLRMAAARAVGDIIVLSGMDSDLLDAARLLAETGGAAWGGSLRKPITEPSLRDALQACLLRPDTAPAIIQAAAPAGPVWTRQDVRRALARQEFTPYFQPKFSLTTGALVGVEALARWHHPQAGLILPADFVPLMESGNLVCELCEVMLATSLDAIAGWTAAGQHIPVAVNASPLTLENVDVPNRWRMAAEARGIDPGMVTIEVTETAVAKDFNNLLESITRLRMHGFRVALDDFGTSYSSLQQVCDLPVNELKIDRSFVQRAATSPRNMMVLETILGLAKKLQLFTVAEGVETAQQYEFVRGLGCDAVQGWYVGRPMRGDHLVEASRATSRMLKD